MSEHRSNSRIFPARANTTCPSYFESKNWASDNVSSGAQKLKKIARAYKKNVKITHCKTKKMQNCATGGGFPRSDPESPFVTVCPPL